jgi:CubicO group peptidase (beta-lactamase class C family)
LPYPPGSDVLLCLGIYGQMIYVNPLAKVVGVKLSSWPVPQDPAILAATLRLFDTCAGFLAPDAVR